MSIEQTLTLKDIRDNNDYTIAKLKDGKCWMVQNLRIVDKQISSSDSATNNSFTIPANNLSNFKFSSSDFGGDSNQLYNNDAVYYDNNPEHGAYYTWHTTTAGAGTNETTENTEIIESICPKGWHLPLRAEYIRLYDNYSNDYSQMTASPIPHFLPFGYISSANPTLDNTKSSYYWSSTASSNSSAYALYTSTSSISSTSGNSKYYGSFVRCVAGNFGQKRTYNITFDTNGSSSSVDPQTGSTYGDSIRIDKSISRGGYEFLGWCTVNPGSGTSCSGQLYKNAIELSERENNINLYATWKIYPSASSFDCSSLAVGDIQNVNDNGGTMQVKKLKDNKCWTTGSGYVATGKNSAYSPSEAQSICPSGWYTLTNSDMTNLQRLYPGCSELQSATHWSYFFYSTSNLWTFNNGSGPNYCSYPEIPSFTGIYGTQCYHT